MSLDMLKQLTIQTNSGVQEYEQQSQRLTFPHQNWLKLAPGLKNDLASWAACRTGQSIEGADADPNETARQRLAELRLIAGFSNLSGEIEQGYKDFGAVVVSGLPTATAADLITGIGAALLELRPEYGLAPKLLTITTDEKATYQAALQSLFELHDDFAFAAEPPDTTFIFCLQPDPHYPAFGQSYLLGSDQLIPLLKKRKQHLLDFALNTPVTLTSDHSPEKTSFTTHLIEPPSDGSGFELRYRRRFMDPAFVRANDALLKEYEEFTQAIAMEFVLNQGDLLIFNNRRFLHGRGPCTLKYGSNGEIISRQVMSIWGKRLL